jgi:membrane-bound lytic murein transglycosylase A
LKSPLQSPSDKTIARLLIAAVALSMFFAAIALWRAPGVRPALKGDEGYELSGFAYQRARFDDLVGWRADDATQPFGALLLSCERILTLEPKAPANPSETLVEGQASLAGLARDWAPICVEAGEISKRAYADESARKSAIRHFYERNFAPVRLYSRMAPKPGGPAEGRAAKVKREGRFTGYFEPFYDASQFRTPIFSAPVYARPADLVTVDLAKFRPELSGQRIAGSVVDGALEPFPDHAAINAGALQGRAEVLAYMRPTDLLFLQIQGSGRLMMPGRVIRAGYDGHNGHVYTAIGKTLIEMGALDRENVSMQTIKAWLESAPGADARKVRETNRSFIFFKELGALPDPALGPVGAEGVQLTPGRSIAVDPRFVALGAPVWVDIPGDEAEERPPLRRLFIAQDTGGAIKGAVRADIFVGSGPEAGEIAGKLNEIGEMYVFVPASLAKNLPDAEPRP